MNWEDFLKSPDIAGTAGAVLGCLSAPGGTLREQAFNLLAGLCCAVFLAPYMAERAGLESKAGLMAFSFVLGLAGLNVLPKITKAIKNIDWSSILSKGGKS